MSTGVNYDLDRFVPSFVRNEPTPAYHTKWESHSIQLASQLLTRRIDAEPTPVLLNADVPNELRGMNSKTNGMGALGVYIPTRRLDGLSGFNAALGAANPVQGAYTLVPLTEMWSIFAGLRLPTVVSNGQTATDLYRLNWVSAAYIANAPEEPVSIPVAPTLTARVKTTMLQEWRRLVALLARAPRTAPPGSIGAVILAAWDVVTMAPQVAVAVKQAQDANRMTPELQAAYSTWVLAQRAVLASLAQEMARIPEFLAAVVRGAGTTSDVPTQILRSALPVVQSLLVGAAAQLSGIHGMLNASGGYGTRVVGPGNSIRTTQLPWESDYGSGRSEANRNQNAWNGGAPWVGNPGWKWSARNDEGLQAFFSGSLGSLGADDGLSPLTLAAIVAVALAMPLTALWTTRSITTSTENVTRAQVAGRVLIAQANAAARGAPPGSFAPLPESIAAPPRAEAPDPNISADVPFLSSPWFWGGLVSLAALGFFAYSGGASATREVVETAAQRYRDSRERGGEEPTNG